MTPPDTRPRLGSGLSTSPSTEIAGAQACSQAGAAMGAGACDLAMVFFTGHHTDEADLLASIVRRELRPAVLIGCSCEAVVAGITEAEGLPGVSVLCGHMPGVSIVPFVTDELPAPEDGEEVERRLAEAMGADGSLRASFVFADPFSTPILHLLPYLGRGVRRGAGPGVPIFGGMASAANHPGGNVLFLGDRVLRAGGVGVSVRGRIEVATVVSQGCRAIGQNLRITKARRNIILELGGVPAVEVIQKAIDDLPDGQRQAARGGVFIGRVIDEYKAHFGPGDYLIRNIVGVDQAQGAVAVADFVHAGQTVRLHVRDARAAHEDLSLLMDAQKLYDRPAGGLLVTCNGRGRKLFGAPNHDATVVSRAFARSVAGEQLAKPGIAFEPRAEPTIPLAGFFGAGEIGPVGSESFLHGHTACVALFRGVSEG